MSVMPGRHLAVLGELTEWWEDVCQSGIGSQAVLLAVPPGWGRTTVLREFRDVVEAPDAPMTLVAWIDGNLPGGPAVQAAGLRDALTAAASRSRLAGLLGLDNTAGRLQLGLAVGGLFTSGLAAAASMLIASLALTAAGNAWDGSPAGEEGAVARAARSV